MGSVSRLYKQHALHPCTHSTHTHLLIQTVAGDVIYSTYKVSHFVLVTLKEDPVPSSLNSFPLRGRGPLLPILRCRARTWAPSRKVESLWVFRLILLLFPALAALWASESQSCFPRWRLLKSVSCSTPWMGESEAGSARPSSLLAVPGWSGRHDVIVAASACYSVAAYRVPAHLLSHK